MAYDSAVEAGGTEIDDLVRVKLYENPCGFSFRLNFLALNFNLPVYGWIEKEFGLQRPDFVVIYSLGLKDGIAARDICSSSGFPRNSISRAVQKLLGRGLIAREVSADDQRSYVLRLTPDGRAIFDRAVQPMVDREDLMMASLSPAERMMLFELLAKMVVTSKVWPETLSMGEELE